MRVLDIHVHVGRRRHLNPRMIDYFSETIGPQVLDFLDNITPEALAAFLDREGVDAAVLLAEYSPRTTGVIPNEFIAEFCSHTDRLIPFGSIDVESGEDSGRQVERAVRELGCKGIKLLCPYGHYYPWDERLMNGYRAAEEAGIPVLFHTGTSLFPGSRIKFANPLLIDEIAEQFPALTMVLCHGGRPFWYKEAEWMVVRHPNVCIDISGIPPKHLPEVFPKFEKYADRFFFGSDFPNIPSIKDHADKIRALPFRPETIQALLADNSSRLLRRKSP